MQPSPIIDRDSPETVYLEKYDWLLRWALHFCANDRDAAEDLVQDVFTQMLVSWSSIRDVEHPEKFLYTYLKYAFLLNLRRDRRHSFQALSAIDFESLHLSLRQERRADPVEMQDGLRNIVAYLGWRKYTAKSASMLLLRFFHGFFPQEIMQIGLLTRKAVDGGLAQAREEAKAYLADPTRIQLIRPQSMQSDLQAGAPPQPSPMHLALPVDEFVGHLRQTIFSARSGDCLPYSVLRARYLDSAKTPIDCQLLAHIVSCERCLDTVSNICGLPPLSKRSPEEAWGFAQRKKSASRKLSAVAGESASRAALRSMEAGRNRYRDAIEHQPRTLMISVDGQVLASRDVGTGVSMLKVEIAASSGMELIEVLSEQELPLLAMPIPGKPPEVAPVLCQRVNLNGGRSAELLIRFNAHGALLELTYCDPLSEEAASHAFHEESISLHVADPAQEEEVRARKHSWLDPLVELTRLLWPTGGKKTRRYSIVVPAIASITGALLLTAMGTWLLRPHEEAPDVFIRRTLSAELKAETANGRHVEYQKIRIANIAAGEARSAANLSIEKDLYRDPQRKRQPRHKQLTQTEKSLSAKLAAAGISWDNPLSAASFNEWHNHAGMIEDRIVRSADDQLTVISSVGDGAIMSETLTVRANDLHPVGRSVEYRNKERIEVAELEYRAIPWAKADPDWFEPTAAIPSSARTEPRQRIPALPAAVLSETELDAAELGARIVLSDLHADTSERLKIERTAHAVEVNGIVADSARANELARSLRQVAHVSPVIHTFAEADAQNRGVTSTIAVQENGKRSSVLEQMLRAKRVPTETIGQIIHVLFETSTTIRQGSTSAVALERKFREESLSPDSREMLHRLESEQRRRILTALVEQQQTLEQLGLGASQGEAPPGGSIDSELLAAGETNVKLCNQLIAQEEISSATTELQIENSRKAEILLNNLAISIARLRRINQLQEEAERSLSAESTGKQNQ